MREVKSAPAARKHIIALIAAIKKIPLSFVTTPLFRQLLSVCSLAIGISAGSARSLGTAQPTLHANTALPSLLQYQQEARGASVMFARLRSYGKFPENSEEPKEPAETTASETATTDSGAHQDGSTDSSDTERGNTDAEGAPLSGGHRITADLDSADVIPNNAEGRDAQLESDWPTAVSYLSSAGSQDSLPASPPDSRADLPAWRPDLGGGSGEDKSFFSPRDSGFEYPSMRASEIAYGEEEGEGDAEEEFSSYASLVGIHECIASEEIPNADEPAWLSDAWSLLTGESPSRLIADIYGELSELPELDNLPHLEAPAVVLSPFSPRNHFRDLVSAPREATLRGSPHQVVPHAAPLPLIDNMSPMASLSMASPPLVSPPLPSSRPLSSRSAHILVTPMDGDVTEGTAGRMAEGVKEGVVEGVAKGVVEGRAGAGRETTGGVDGQLVAGQLAILVEMMRGMQVSP